MKKNLFIALIIIPFLTYSQVNKIFRKAIRSTDLKERIELFSQVINLDSKNFDAYFYRALAKNDLGDYNGAILDYSKIIVFEPNADTYYQRGNSKYNIQNIQGAQEDYFNAVKLDPNFTDAIFKHGCAQYDLENYEGAIESFTNALNKNALQPKVFNLRASAYLALKKYLEALNDFTYAIMIDPNADNYLNRGEFYMEINYYKKANDDFTNSIKLNSNNTFSHFYRGTSCFLLGKYMEAISDFTKVLEFDTLDFDALLGLAQSYYKINDLKKAKLYFNKAKRIILTNNTTKTGLEIFIDTYWYQKQIYTFTKNHLELIKI